MSTGKLSLALMALIALTPLLAAIPVAPAVAAVETPTVTIDYPYLTVSNKLGTRTITIENPLGNPDIVEVKIYIPSEAATDASLPETDNCTGFLDGTKFKKVSDKPWIILGVAETGFAESYGAILPDGGVGNVTLSITSIEKEEEEGVVDKFTITVTVKFRDGTTKTVKLDLYEGLADELAIKLENEITNNTIKAGEEVTIKVSTYSEGYEKADKGLPIVIWAVNPDLDNVKIAEVVTDADGHAEASYTPTEAGNWTFKADVVIDAPIDIGAQLTLGKQALTVKAAAPTKVVVKTEFDVEDYDLTYLNETEVDVWVTLADAYGNTVEIEDEYKSNSNVTLTATKGVFLEDGTEVNEITVTISEHVTYKPDPVYGTYAMISAKLEVPEDSSYAGTYTGTSKKLRTSTFATDVTVEPKDPTNVQAGEYATITAKLNVVQEGVPVTFEITAEDYGGYLSVISTTTDEDGVAKTKLYVDTEVDAETTVKAVVAKPLTDNPDNTFPGESAKITTKPGEPTKLGIEISPSAVEPGETATVRVYLADAYGNEASKNIFDAAIKVTLTATAGELEKSYVYIPSDWKEGTPVEVEYTAPEALGTYTITASTTQYDLGSASANITVTTLEPIVNITQPAEDTTMTTTENVTTTYIAGWAKPSPAAPEGTVISVIKYSLDGAANVTVPIVKVEDSKAFFNFSVTLTVNATHEIVVWAVDSEGNEGSATRIVTVSYAPPVPVMPTEVSEASTDKPSYSSGEEVKITGTVTNVGVEAKTVIIRITFIDPTGVPQYPIYELKLTLQPGQSVTPTATYLAGAVSGTWKAKIMVVDAVTGEAVAEPVELTVTVG